MATPLPNRILFVCTGNICRSPTADAVMQHALSARGIASQFTVDSVGTHSYHVGEAPDPRTIVTAAQHGINMQHLRARKLRQQDFHDYDILLAMDHGHLRNIQSLAPTNHTAEVALYLPYCGISSPEEIPDPYYGGQDGFDQVLDLCLRATDNLLARIG